MSTAVVIDDTLGPPAAGALSAEDKGQWLEYVMGNPAAQVALLEVFSSTGIVELNSLLSLIISTPAHIAELWEKRAEPNLSPMRVDLLFSSFDIERLGKADKPLEVCRALEGLLGADKVKRLWRMEDLPSVMLDADVLFVDFFLDDNEPLDRAVQRIRNHAPHLKKAKLVFFMSSRAEIEVQEKMREVLGIRSAFFDVMRKIDITAELIAEKVRASSDAYAGNKAIEQITDALATAINSATEEFKSEYEQLELHDLRLLDISRLASEGESISTYLSWLASESIAAKIRRFSSANVKNVLIDPTQIGFSGKIRQRNILFNLFSEVVFSPGHGKDDAIHFGEVLIQRARPRAVSETIGRLVRVRGLSTLNGNSEGTRAIRRKARRGVSIYDADRVSEPVAHGYLLVLTPACDLVRCSPSQTVLCVRGTGVDYSDPRNQVREKLFGKHDHGLRHLLLRNGTSPELVTWHKGQTVMLTVRELKSAGFVRLAQMNEIYAQEVKEEVLREIGRVGTQINPSPVFLLHGTLKWKVGTTSFQEAPRQGDFYSATVTYLETHKEKAAAIVISDEFRSWAVAEIKKSLGDATISVKLEKCLKWLCDSKQIILKNDFTFKKDELVVRVDMDSNKKSTDNAVLELTLTLVDAKPTKR